MVTETGSPPTPYEQFGGGPRVEALVEAFYGRVKRDAVLRPFFPGHMGCAKRFLTHFLTEILGGPPLHSENRQSSLREGHAKYRIGVTEQQAWVTTMRDALGDLGVQEPLRGALERFFDDSAKYLINSSPPPGPQQDATDSLTEIQSDLHHRWERQQALEELLMAREAGDIARVLSLADHPLLVNHLPAQRAAVAAAGIAGEPEWLEWAGNRLDRYPALLTARGDFGLTLLQTAAAGWAAPFVALLLARGADPNVDSHLGHPTLCCAANRTVTARSRNRDQAHAVVAMLVEAGAEINAAGGVKRTTALHNAARRGSVEMVAALLDCGAELEVRDSAGETPLRRAVNCGKPQAAALLLARGANPYTRSHAGTTPCDAARTPALRQVLKPWLDSANS
jgi:hemoglobin